ncbi:MAG TPA: hypothetical protein VGB24_12785, partial [Longimicrobium sp.]|uniref:beta strand repeat-containing protein n=1 Tax=Longimicrobium sp. TaxID=2029185 RepID=UPI002ED7FEC9
TLTFSGALTATNGTGLQFNAALGTYTFSGSASLGGTDAGVDITNGSTGTFNFNASTQITNTAGTGVNVYGSAPTVTYSGNITKSGTSTGRLVEVGEQTGGAVTFNTGTLLANSTNALSTGISLSNADGTVSFNGTTTLGGGDAGVDIVSGSGGTFTFGTGTGITSPAGTAFRVNASTPNVTYNGNITQVNAQRAVDISSQSGGASRAANGTITFQTGTIAANTSSTGILLNDVDGTVNFNGTTTLLNGDAGIDVENTSTGSITFGAGASVTNATNELIRIVSGASPLAFTYSGSFQRSSGTGAGILVNSTTGATITFDGNPATETKSIVLAAGSTAAGVNLSGTNTSTTVNFTNGGLVVSTDDGAAFTATGGGTVNVTGASNTLTATGGAALNIQNTTIGSGRMTFQSIAANGGANGIVLNNTGSDGGLTVAGTGVALSGGTLQNHTQVGIVLTSTFDPKFNNVRVLNTTHSGVHGKGVTNFEFTNGTIDQSGDGPSPGASVNESNILFYDFANTTSSTNVSGVVTITNNTLSNALYHGIYLYNRGGTISNLNVSTNVITTPTSSTNSVGSGIIVDLQGGGASITKGAIDNNNILNVPTGVGINVVCGGVSAYGTCGTPGSATNVISISKDTIWGVSAAAPIGSEGIVANMNGQGQGNFVVDQNNIRHTKGRAMGVSAFGQVRMQSAVTNNVIVSAPLFDATNMEIGADSTSGIASFASYTATVANNNVSGHTGVGIYALARGSSDTLKVKLIGNTVAAPNTTSSARAGIRVDAGSSAGQPMVCARIESNVTGGSTNSGTGSTSPGINIREEAAGTNPNPPGGPKGGTFRIHNLSPSSGATKAQAETFLSSANPSSTTGSFGTGGAAALVSAATYESCSLP